jgi:hypothetical protein
LLLSGELVKCLEQARALLISKVDPNSNRDQLDVTAEMDRLTKKVMSKHLFCHYREHLN